MTQTKRWTRSALGLAATVCALSAASCHLLKGNDDEKPLPAPLASASAGPAATTVAPELPPIPELPSSLSATQTASETVQKTTGTSAATSNAATATTSSSTSSATATSTIATSTPTATGTGTGASSATATSSTTTSASAAATSTTTSSASSLSSVAAPLLSAAGVTATQCLDACRKVYTSCVAAGAPHPTVAQITTCQTAFKTCRSSCQ